MEQWPEDALMQSIAMENNLAETAFVVRREDHYDLRWFTPKVEIDLCGHATLASAFVIAHFVDPDAVGMRFETMSGTLAVRRADDLYEMDFPARAPRRIEPTDQMARAIGLPIIEAHLSRDLLLLVDSEEQVRNLNPDFERLKRLSDCFAVIVTAKGEQVDFVSRFFAPCAGIPEDPVTGSSHSTLIPFWAQRLNRKSLTAWQLSARGGTLYCQDYGDRVRIEGKAALYLQGEILAGA